MKKVFLSCTTVLLMGAAAVYGHKAFTPQTELSPIQLENAEAIAAGESNIKCGYAAYEWDDDFFEDTKKFIKCTQGCPEGSGTEPKYIICNF